MARKPAKIAGPPPFPIADISVADIDFDLRNSRFPRDAENQEDALALMLTTSAEDCMELLRDMTRSGRLNSSDLPIVLREQQRYVMMEGNRRLTCLMLWRNPSSLMSHDSLWRQYGPRIQRLVIESPYKAPDHIRATIAPTEVEADAWIERKHSGGAGGAGTVEWGAAMKDRRRARNDVTRTSRAMAFIALVSRAYEDEADIQLTLEIVRSQRYTMIQRFVDRSVVRERLGLHFEAGEMRFLYGEISTMPAIRRVFHDFAQPKSDSGKTWARELDTVDDFKRYLEKFSELLPNTSLPEGDESAGADEAGWPHAQKAESDATAGDARPATTDEVTKPEPDLGEEVGGTNNAPPTSADGRPPTPDGGHSTDGRTPPETSVEPGERSPKPTPQREHVFRGLVLDQFTLRIQELVRGTSLLSARRQSEIVAVMLRVILDLTTYQFLTSRGQQVPRNLDDRLRSAIKIMEPSASDALGTAEDTSPLRKAFHGTTSNSIRLVQYAVHDIYTGSTPSELFTLADRYTPVLRAMNASMGSAPIK